MEVKKVYRYYAECGRAYWSKKACLAHEAICNCWTNPKLKTCKTCKFGEQITDSNGMEHEPQYLHTWKQWECRNPKFDYDIHFTPAHETVSDLCINCPVYESKK